MLNTGNSEFLLFYRLLPSDQGDAAVVMVELSISNSIKRYLENYKNKRLTAEQCILTLAAFSPKEYRWALPPKYSAEQKLLQLAENVWATNQPIFKVDNETLKGFALGTRPNALSGVCLLAFSSNEKVQSTLSKMKKRIVIGALIAFILLTSVAIWISRQLISPLGFLSKGVEALAARKFETRLPEPPGNDEIAQLFKAFNNMMAESYDMQIAHNVQEGLLPQNFPEIEGFSVHGFLREASELGGDCLDCFMLNDKKLFFLVGDITGHGVGSALIMAFSRAITFHWSQQDKDLLPASLADHIDGMLRKNRTERMFMGIICGTLDIENQCIELVVKGHIYPLHLKADGTSNWVGLPAYPLGIAKQTPAKSIVFSFNPGDKLLCMTDGILEARAQNKVLGFNGIEEWAEQTRSANAKEWIKQIEVLYSNWTNTTQHDDISIFALCNNRDKK
jgi:HAMP domain-containing protein